MAVNKVATTCFTDIEDSAALTEQFGETVFGQLRSKYFAVCEALAHRNEATSVKNTGDGHMITFDDLVAPLNFAAQLQAFYHPNPNYLASPLKFRVGLFSGVINQGIGDAFGSGVNRAARVESKTPVGAVWVNEDIQKQLTIIWGDTKAKQLFGDQGNIDVKKIAPIRMYSFDWQKYIKLDTDNGLAALVLKQLQDASVIVFNLDLPGIASLPPVIWPVVPRDGVNAIHCGQLAMMRLLALLGSQINVLIADCGATNNPTRQYSEAFRKEIDSFATKIGIRNIRFRFMSDLFTPLCEGCEIFHRHFQEVISKLSFETLVAANDKDYTDSVKEAIKKAPTLDFLKPALTIASVLHLSELEARKCIVIVGNDERIQWKAALDFLPGTRERFGVLFNPVLNMKQGAQVHQTHRVTLYYAWNQIVEDMEKYELLEWLTKLHLFLLAFPEQLVKINDVKIMPHDWLNGKSIEDKIDKAALAKLVYANILTR